MDAFTPLTRPDPPPAKIDPTPKSCLSDGFNYPSFRLLNKQGRVTLSSSPLTVESSTSYHLFATANLRGWFAAVVSNGSSSSIIFSPLTSLHSSFENSPEPTFSATRFLSLPSSPSLPANSTPTLIKFFHSDTRFLVGLSRGHILIYDTSVLFSPGSTPIDPLHIYDTQTNMPLRQILPNPGVDTAVADLIAIVRADGVVELLNENLEQRGGWIRADPQSIPVAAAWSPKGKHIAIGLNLGGILTYSLSPPLIPPHRHIPPTCPAPLHALYWLSPGHAFLTSYSSTPDPTHHIISVDLRTPTGSYTILTHPFQLPDRPTPHAYLLPFHRWDFDPSQPSDDPKMLLVLGDSSSIDLEVLGVSPSPAGIQCFQQSQENPLTLPLNKEMEETALLSLEADLTEADGTGDAKAAGTPVMYSYLNDGTLQGWYVEHTDRRAYSGMIKVGVGAGDITRNMASSLVPQQQPQVASTSSFGQPHAAQHAGAMSTFGKPAFGQASTPSVFGQPASTSAFGQPAFGQVSTLGQRTGPFGQNPTSSAFMQTSAFGNTQSGSAFGQSSQPSTITTTSAFGQPSAPGSAVGQSSAFPSAFGQQLTSVFGQSSASASSSPSASPFGQSGLNTSNPPFGQQPSTTSAFGGDSTGTFGGGSPFGGGTTGAFGSSSTPSAFGSGSSPSGGPFGAFNSFSGTTNAFGQPSFGFGSGSSTSTGSPPAPSANPTLSPTPASAPDNMTREASMSDSTPSFGGLSLGDSNSKFNTSKAGIFGVSASPPPTPSTSSFGGGGVIKPASGFGTFNNFQTSSTAGSGKPGKSADSALVSNGEKFSTGGFGQPSFGQSGFATAQPAFGQTGFGQPAFSNTGLGKQSVSPVATSASAVSGGFSSFASARPTAFGTAGGVGGGGFSAFASNKHTAFGAGAEQSDGRNPGNAASESSKPAFSSAGSGGGNVFNSGSAFGSGSGGSVLGGTSTPSTPAKMTDIPTSPSSSPDSSPIRSLPLPHTDESPPAQSFFRSASGSTAVSSGSGAFGNLKTTISSFKPASGFGAFGSDTTPASSPFFKAAQTTTPPSVSAFAEVNSPVATPTKTASAPTFGATSMLGATKSPFSSPSTITPKTPLTPAESSAETAFSAFSDSSAGFGAFAGPKISFGELLKGGNDDTRGPVKSKTLGTTSPQDTEKKGGTLESAQPQPESKAVSVSASPKPTPAQILASRTPEAPEAPKPKEQEESTTPKGTTKASASVFALPTKEKVPCSESDTRQENEEAKAVEKIENNASVEKPGSSTSISDEPSFGNLSITSTASSFVEVSQEDESRTGDIDRSSLDCGGGDEDEDDDDDRHPEDDSHSFLSDSYNSESETENLSDEAEGADDGESADGVDSDTEDSDSSRSARPEPTTVPLPGSRSPSATPQPEVPVIQVTPSPSASDTSESSRLSTIEEESTTPPGTPTKESTLSLFNKNLFSASSSSTSPVGTPPLGLGLGRPSTRPARSSPLASAPVSGDDDGDEKYEDNARAELAPKPPVSPQPRFGKLKIDSVEEIRTPNSNKPTRPKTPPLLSAFGTAKQATPGLSAPGPATSPPTSSPTSTPYRLSSEMPPQAALSLDTQTSPTPPPNLFGDKSKVFAPPATLASTKLEAAILAPPPTSGLFGNGQPITVDKTTTSMPAVSISGGSGGFGSSTFGGTGGKVGISSASASAPWNNLSGGSPDRPASKLPASSASPPVSSTAAQPTTEVTVEEGMQRECALLCIELNRELEDLRLLADKASKKRVELGKWAGGSRKKADLGHAAKWGLADSIQFGAVLEQYGSDLVSLREHRDAQSQALRELQNSMLKAGTRKEEISRFNKAKTDNEFAKMLKSRTLGPEHLETQTQLRRNIRTTRDRIQKLEDHLKSSKKKLSQITTGKPGLKAPSLDTINRTYRNIDLAIHQQADEVANLASRVSKLDITLPLKAPRERDARLPDPVSRRPYNVTPHVAITTAAALNAERSAHKLKRALLAVRKEPLLNTDATVAPPAPLAFSTPPNGSNSSGSSFAFQTPTSGPLFAPSELMLQTPLPDSALPNDNFNPSTPPFARRGAGGGVKKHNSVPLKRSAGTSSTPATSDFDWGALPTFNQAPSHASMGGAVKFTPLTQVAPAAKLTSPVPPGGFSWGALPSFNQTVTNTSISVEGRSTPPPQAKQPVPSMPPPAPAFSLGALQSFGFNNAS